MNFVICPMVFLSSALSLWKMAEASPLLRDLCLANPFTRTVDLIRFTLCRELAARALALARSTG